MADDILKRLSSQPPFNTQSTPPVEEKKEEPQQEQEKPKEEVPQEQPQKQEEPKGEQPQEEKLPEEVKERTKEQFEKLKRKNQELKEQLKKYNDVLTSLQPQEVAPPNQYTPYFEPIITNQPPTPQQYPGLTQQQINETFDQLVDNEGYVNVDLLKEELKKRQEREKILQQEINRLKEEVQSTKKTVDDYQRSEYMKKIHQKYPQIDPESPQFNPIMWEAVRNEIIGQWTTQGKEDVEAAAEKWLKILYPNMSNDKQQEKKEQINALSPKPTSTVDNFEDHEALIAATRKGKKGALRERLKRAGY